MIIPKNKEEARIQTHKIEQEDYKKEIEKLDEIVIKLDIAGGFDKPTGFVYEPLGEYKYIFKFKGYKGIGFAGYNKEEKRWELNTDLKNLKLYFEKKPLYKLIFKVPNKECVDFWLNNYLIDDNDKEIDEKFIYGKLKGYFKTFYDMPLERDYDNCCLLCFQSYLNEILDVVFYLEVVGETGSAKTALLEGLRDVCKHGMMAGNIKVAGIARCIEKYKLTLFIDELDNKKARDEDVEGILRQGYRKNDYYIRMMPKSHEPEFFNVFGIKGFSYRSSVADDLSNRSISVNMKKTKNQVLPVINIFKHHFSPFELMFFWHLDNISYIFTQSPNFKYHKDIYYDNHFLNSLNDINDININNNIIYGNIAQSTEVIAHQTPNFVNFVKFIKERHIFGRNIEMAYLIYSMSKLLNLDIDKILLETIIEKQEMEDADEEEGWGGLLRDILVEEYNKAELKDTIKVIKYKQAIGSYLKRMKEVYDNIPSQQLVKKMLRQMGFIDGINRKVMWLKDKAYLCLIYDKDIQERLGIIEEQTKIG